MTRNHRVFSVEFFPPRTPQGKEKLRATWRGFSLPEETGRFLLSRVDRGAGSLFRLLDRLDRAALAAQKKLTVPFVRSVLDAEG